jgi:hypothetical protein
MLEKWEDAMAAAPHTTSIDREEHSVTKGYGAQTRRQHNKALTQKTLSICGKRLLDLYNNSQESRSEFNKSRRSINGSVYEISSQGSLFAGRNKPCEDNNSSQQRLALHRYRSFLMADSNTTRDSAGDVCVGFPPTSKTILGLTEVLKGSKKLVFEKSRLPGSNFSPKYDSMGLHPARPNSSNMTTVSCDEHSDNYLHVLEMSDSNAVSPIREDNKIHSLIEQQMVSKRDKPSSTVSCQLQSDIMMNHCDNSHHRTV